MSAPFHSMPSGNVICAVLAIGGSASEGWRSRSVTSTWPALTSTLEASTDTGDAAGLPSGVVAAVVCPGELAVVSVLSESEDEPQPVAVATASAARTKNGGRTRMSSGAYIAPPAAV